MPQLLPFLQLTDDNGACFELFNNCRTLAYIRNLQAGRWRLSECEDCCPDCIDGGGYFTPELDETWWAAGNPDPANNEFLGLFVHSMWIEPASSVRRRGETLLSTVAYTPRRLEVVGELITDSVRGAALAWEQLADVLASCGSDGWTATVQAFCPDEGELGAVDLAALAAATFYEPETPPEISDHCDPCRRIDPEWVPTPLPADNTQIVEVADSGARQLLRVRIVSIDEDADGAQIPDCEGIPVKLVFEVFSDDFYGDPIPLPCFDMPIGGATGAAVVTCYDDGETPDPLPAGAAVLDCVTGAQGLPGEVVATCNVTVPDRPPAECRPFRWDWACSQSGSVDACLGVDMPTNGARPAATNTGAYCFPYWRRVVSCLIPRLPSPVDGVLQLEIDSGSGPLGATRFELWPAWDGVEDPATCSGEEFYRSIVPCETWEIPRLEAGSTLNIDGTTGSVTVACFGGPPVAADGLVSGRDGGRTRHPVISPNCRWWLVVTLDCDQTADDATIRAYFVPRYT